MNLGSVQIVIRPRTAWEAVDLGFAMVTRFRGPVYRAWWATAGPVSALILALTWDRVGWSLFLLWLAKALFDRVPLFVLSRSIFGDTPSTGQVLLALPRLWTRHVLTGLTLYRLHPMRTFLLPVPELEGLRWLARSRREGTLLRRGSGEAIICAFTCQLFELIVAFLLILLVTFVVEGGVTLEILGSFLTAIGDPESAPALSIALRAALVVGMGVVGPAHVGAGFALYLNRRVHLEGWDVELAFRRLVRRLEEPATSPLARIGAAAVALPLLLCFGAWGGSGGSIDQEGGEPDPAVAIEGVLSHPDFDTTIERTRWIPPWGESSSEGEMGAVPFAIAPLLEVLLWGAAIAALAWIVMLLLRRAGFLFARRPTRAGEESPTHAFGLDLRPETLPDDIPGAAWALWCAGDFAGATGLLYRAAIAGLVERDGLELLVGDTEGDCLARARGFLEEARAAFFARVTRAWQACAYSPTAPPEAEIDALCRDFSVHFQGGAP